MKDHSEARHKECTSQREGAETVASRKNGTESTEDEPEGQKPPFRLLTAWIAFRSNIRGFLEGIAAIAVMVAAFIYWKQWREQTNVRLTDISVHRPYMAPTNLQPRFLPDKSYLVVQEWKNFGSTPTRNLEIEWNWGHYLPGQGATLYTRRLKGPVAPNDGSIHDEMAIPVEEFKRIAAGSHAYTWGTLIYGDDFPGNGDERHLVEYCADISYLESTNGNYYDRWLTSVCPTHNCFDEECKDEYSKLNPAKR